MHGLYRVQALVRPYFFIVTQISSKEVWIIGGMQFFWVIFFTVTCILRCTSRLNNFFGRVMTTDAQGPLLMDTLSPLPFWHATKTFASWKRFPFTSELRVPALHSVLGGTAAQRRLCAWLPSIQAFLGYFSARHDSLPVGFDAVPWYQLSVSRASDSQLSNWPISLIQLDVLSLSAFVINLN